jgi:hypothetical protein
VRGGRGEGGEGRGEGEGREGVREVRRGGVRRGGVWCVVWGFTVNNVQNVE